MLDFSFPIRINPQLEPKTKYKRKPQSVFSVEKLKSSVHGFGAVNPDSSSVIVVPFLTVQIIYPHPAYISPGKNSDLKRQESCGKTRKTIPHISTGNERSLPGKPLFAIASQSGFSSGGGGLVEFISFSKIDL